MAEPAGDNFRFLARSLAHDFNNLLGAILGNASLLKVLAEPGSDTAQIAEVIERAAQRATDLAGQLHRYAGDAVYRMDPIDLHHVIDEVVGLLRGSLEPGVRLVVQLASTRPVIQGNTGQLHQMLMNLALNARDAAGSHGEIRIATADDGHRLLLSVGDNGPGVPASARGQVFEPFYTTKEAGTGLGLAIVHRVARNHGASAEIGDSPSGGAEFRFRFP